MNSARTLLSIKELEIDYPSRDGQGRVTAVKDLNLDLAQGEIGCLLGSSGCGKSTLLYILSTMDTDYSGELFLDNQLLTGQKPDFLAKIEYVSETVNLLSSFTSNL